MNIDFKDLAGLSKPIEKAIEAVRAGIGVAYEPTRIRKKADAEAYAAIKATEASLQSELMKRTFERIAVTEMHRQLNIENIANVAIEMLPSEVSEDPVSPDWSARFFDAAKDVSDEEMQQLWSGIFASEVTEPGRNSYRTLEIMKCLNKKDASLFKSICGFVLNSDDQALVPNWLNSKKALEEAGINIVALSHLKDLGLVGETIVLKAPGEGIFLNMKYFQGRFGLIGDSQIQNWNPPKMILLSQSGFELFRICGARPVEGYLETLLSDFKIAGFKIVKLP